MQRVVVAIMLLMLLACPGQAAGFLEDAQTNLVYARSFSTGEGAMVIQSSFPIYQGTIGDKPYALNIDALGFIEEADLGFGGSFSIRDVVGKFSIGIGWLPKGQEFSWYIGHKF